MRKILLAGAAMLATTTVALAVVPGDSVSITTTVAQACTVSISENTVAIPEGGSVTGNYSFQCNFSGSTADVVWDSANDGVTDTVNTYDYNITTSLGGVGLASTGLTESNRTTVANTPVNATFELSLVPGPKVAGTYLDVLSVSIAP